MGPIINRMIDLNKLKYKKTYKIILLHNPPLPFRICLCEFLVILFLLLGN